jgi:hypothetical protein
MIFFICMGGLLPYIKSELGAEFETPEYSTDGTISEIESADESTNAITGSPNVWDILLSVFKMFFWTFGDIHWIIDLLVFTPLRIILALTIARNIWIGGGG